MLISLHPFQEDDPCHLPLLAIFCASIGGVWFFGISRWKNLLTSLGAYYLDDDDTTTEDPVVEDFMGMEPTVTIQICAYNESVIVKETIARACSQDWPKDRLYVQVCDDSTEKESIAIIENEILRWQEKGFRISRLERPDRIGFKAGNLSCNFRYIEGDFVAYLDADHQIGTDFLRKTIPHFYDSNGKSKDHIGLVQTPWSYYNTHQNLLTECDSLGLDIHHVVEQVGRFTAYKVFGFNGTGGVWRREAIERAGGFSWETVTEDLMLSYKAYLAGYEFVYVRDCPQQLEVPGSLLAHIQQKQRWTKGFMQVFRIFYLDLLLSRQVPFVVKFEALMHLTGPIQLVFKITCLITYPYMVFHGIDSYIVKTISCAAIVEPVVSAAHAIISKVPGENQSYSTWWSRMMRFLFILPYFALRFGMVLFEVKSILEGIFSDDATFLVTPKEGAQGNAKVSQEKLATKVKRNWLDDFTASLGICLGLHQAIYIFFVDSQFRLDSYSYVFVRMMNMMICIGLFWVNGAFLAAKHPKVVSAVLQTVRCRPVLLFAALMLLATNSFVAMLQWNPINAKANPALVPFDPLIPSAAVGPLDSLVSSITQNSPWVCPSFSTVMDHTEDVDFQHRDPMVIFGEPRTGSNLFLDFLNVLRFKANSTELDLNILNELYIKDEVEQGRLLAHITDAMNSGCDLSFRGPNGDLLEKTYEDSFEKTPNANPKGFMEFVRKQTTEKEWLGYQSLFQAFSQREVLPVDWLNYMRKIPSRAQKAYFAFKVFKEHFDDLSIDPAVFITSLQQYHMSPKYVVLWRRRVIESFVSYKIAVKKNTRDSWLGTKTSSKDTVYVDKQELEDFIATKKQYYVGIRDALLQNGFSFEVFEYDRDLSDRSKQYRTVQRLQDFLHVRGGLGVNVPEEVLNETSVTKQRQVSIESQVENWVDVVAWGYGGETEEWEDLFDTALATSARP